MSDACRTGVEVSFSRLALCTYCQGAQMLCFVVCKRSTSDRGFQKVLKSWLPKSNSCQIFWCEMCSIKRCVQVEEEKYEMDVELLPK